MVIAGSNAFGACAGAFISNAAIDLTGRSKLRVYYTYIDTSINSQVCCTDTAAFTIGLLNTSSYSDPYMIGGNPVQTKQNLNPNPSTNYSSPVDLSFSFSGSKYIMVRYDDSKATDESLSISITNISLIC